MASVHMITYNHAPYIAQAIEGVLSQKTIFPYELVIGEDCSTDGTREIVTRYASKFKDITRIVTSSENVGMVMNSYRTSMKCRGTYVAFCEGDDYWHCPEKLQRQVEYLEENPECGLICSDFDTYYVANRKRVVCTNRIARRNPLKMNDIKHTLRGISGIQTCTVMVRNNLLKETLFSDPFFYQDPTQPCLDRPLWIGIMLKSQVGYIDESMATYNRLPFSATSDSDPKKLLEISIKMKEQIIKIIDKYSISDGERELHEKDLLRRKLKLSFYERNEAVAIECKERLKELSLIEKIQYLGACNSHYKMLFAPLFKFFYKGIPRSRY